MKAGVTFTRFARAPYVASMPSRGPGRSQILPRARAHEASTAGSIGEGVAADEDRATEEPTNRSKQHAPPRHDIYPYLVQRYRRRFRSRAARRPTHPFSPPLRRESAREARFDTSLFEKLDRHPPHTMG